MFLGMLLSHMLAVRPKAAIGLTSERRAESTGALDLLRHIAHHIGSVAKLRMESKLTDSPSFA